VETYNRLGITVYEAGEELPGAPIWAVDPDDGVTLRMPIIHTSDLRWYSLPLSSTDAIQLTRYCADFAKTGELPLNEEEIESLERYLQDDNSRRLKEFKHETPLDDDIILSCIDH
jgi:hypothetical protein